ncbi:MAG: hypothetical protein ACYCOR_04240 [Acidobacteriaceae bacterium]
MIGHFPLQANAKKATCTAGFGHQGLSGAGIDRFDAKAVAAISHASTQIKAATALEDDRPGPSQSNAPMVY